MRAKGMQDKMGSPRMIQVSRLWDNAWSWGISQGVYQSEWQTETDQQQSGNLPTPLLGSYLSSGIRPLGLIEAGCEPSNDAGFGKSTDRSKSDPMAETSGPRLVMQCPCKWCWNSWKCPFLWISRLQSHRLLSLSRNSFIRPFVKGGNVVRVKLVQGRRNEIKSKTRFFFSSQTLLRGN